MGQSSNCAAAKDVQTKPSEVAYVKGTGHIAIHKMNPLRLDQNMIRLLQPPIIPISVHLDLHPEVQKDLVFLKR